MKEEREVYLSVPQKCTKIAALANSLYAQGEIFETGTISEMLVSAMRSGRFHDIHQWLIRVGNTSTKMKEEINECMEFTKEE